MSYHPSETSLFPTRTAEDHDHHNNKWRSRSHAKNITKALITIGEASRANLDSVTIIGGGDSGFLAAVAEWLFDMKIAIVGNDNQELYRTSVPGSTVQVRFKFRDRMAQSPSQHMELEAFQYARKTVYLKDVSGILFANDSNEAMKVSGRLEWSHCLSSAFGYAFATLLDRKENFSRVSDTATRDKDRTHRGKEVAFYQAPNDRSVCAALAIGGLLFNQYCVMINEECRTCTLDMAVAEVETPQRLFIASFSAFARLLKLKDYRCL